MGEVNVFIRALGLAGTVTSLAEEAGSGVEISDERSAGRTQDFPFNATLTGIQRAAVDEVARHELGVLVAPPGSGKTAIASALIAAHGSSTLILVDRKALALHRRDPTNSGWFWAACGGLAALFALDAWGRRKFFLRLDERLTARAKERLAIWVKALTSSPTVATPALDRVMPTISRGISTTRGGRGLDSTGDSEPSHSA